MYPILFRVGSFEVHVWGLLVVAGIMAGLWLATRLAAAILWFWQMYKLRAETELIESKTKKQRRR